jgi:hypothetical protein
MAKIKNISPLGDVAVPALGLTVKAGATVDVADDAAASLLQQTQNWAPADQAAASVTPATPAPQSPTPEAPVAPVAPTN